MSPDTVDGSSSGYSSDGAILGFSPTHVSGTGGNGKYGNFRVTPTAGPLRVGTLSSPKSGERASPGYYAVALQQDQGSVLCELTATRMVGVQRFTFPARWRGNIVLEVTSHVLESQRATHAEVQVVDDRHMAGSASFTGGWNPSPYTIYFYAEFSRPAMVTGTWTAGPDTESLNPGATYVEGDQTSNPQKRAGAYAVFNTHRNRVVQLKIAVSFISAEKARSNLEQETSNDSFDSVRARAEQAWENVLTTIEITGGADAQRRIFYSSLFRVHYMPHDLTGDNPWWDSTEPHYEDFYTLWDTFRTVHPMFTLIEPERQRDMVRSLIDTYRHTGWLPDARIGGANGLTQVGTNGDVLVADAAVKGLDGIDYAIAYQALVQDAEVESPDPIYVGRQLEDYKRLGYMSVSFGRSASRTLEYSYDDFCISEVARILGHDDDARRYLARSANWSNLWDSSARCIHPRYADGRWLENYSCEYDAGVGWDFPFYEGSGRQYSTYVPHDVAGLIGRLGGDASFVAWLDDFFDRQLYTPGNEQDLLAPYLYIHAGRPDRTALRVRALVASVYRPTRDGLPGNDDAGTMSSWYIWGAIGLYPLAGQPFYYIGSPIFTESVIHLAGGKTLVIDAPETSDQNLYVQSAEWNGVPLDRAWLNHAEIVAGGRLLLHMGPTPSGWGSANRPPNGISQ